METANPYSPGQAVVTRRGKRGVVESIDGELCNVRFGSAVYPMKWSALVSDRSYSRMIAPRQRQMYQ